jgi:hypothetical protein
LPHLTMPMRGPQCKLGYHRVFNPGWGQRSITEDNRENPENGLTFS